MKNWFEINKEGLAKIVERKGKAFVLFELIQNAWDQNVTEVHVSLKPVEGKRQAEIVVEDDDPDGFANLAHAYTLFAESIKKGDPEKRGRFNIGEKLVLALCEEAEISTTRGTIAFDESGRHHRRVKRERGSSFRGVVKMTKPGIAEVEASVSLLIPPDAIETHFNGTPLRRANPLAVIEETLPTVITNKDGSLRESKRKTTIEIFELPPGDDQGYIHEMGIPVVETDIPYWVNVGQKIPLNMDRDNVRPAYAKALKAIVLNAMADSLDEEGSSASWVTEGLGDKRCKSETAKVTFKGRFGENAIVADPTDPESINRAIAMGFTIVHGGSLPGDAWKTVRKAGFLTTSKDVAPTNKPGDTPPIYVSSEDWTEGMRQVVKFTKLAAESILGRRIRVAILNNPTVSMLADYGGHGLRLNYGRLGDAFFDRGISREVLKLLIHEFAHEYASNHLSDDFHKATCKVGAAMTQLALKESELF